MKHYIKHRSFFLKSDQWPIIQTFLLHIFFYFWPTIYYRTNLSRRLCGMYQLKLEISFHEINWCICNHLAENSIWIHMGARTGQTQIYQKFFFFCIIKYVKTHNYNWHKVNTFFFEIKVFEISFWFSFITQFQKIPLPLPLYFEVDVADIDQLPV